MLLEGTMDLIIIIIIIPWLLFVDLVWAILWHMPGKCNGTSKLAPFLCAVPLLLPRWTLPTRSCPLVRLSDVRTIMIVYSLLLNIMQERCCWTYVLSCQSGTALHVRWTASHSMSFCSMSSGAVSVCNQIAHSEGNVTNSFLLNLKAMSFISCGMLLFVKTVYCRRPDMFCHTETYVTHIGI